MNNYECKLCNYQTKKQGNYNRHINSIKHHKKVLEEMNIPKPSSSPEISEPYGSHMDPIWIIKGAENSIKNTNDLNNFDCDKISDSAQKRNYMCNYCNHNFSGANNLARHKKSCSTKKITESEYEIKFREMQSKIELLEKETDKYRDESKHFQEENKYHKQLLNEAGGLVKKSVSSLTYVVNNYGSAPTIELLNIDNLVDLEENNKKLVEDVISAYKHKTLDKYLGDSIIKLYKKDNPEDQSIWSTDTNRLTYLIKELMVNDSSSWIIDKKGTKTKKYLIDPLLKHIKSLIIYYQKNSMNLSTNEVEIEYILETNKKILKLVADIDDEVIGNNLLRYISTHLFFSDKLLK